jgi:hypothetical protein
LVSFFSPGLLYRQLIPKTARDQQPDRSNGYARLVCTASDDKEACQKSSVLEEVQGDYYPRTCGFVFSLCVGVWVCGCWGVGGIGGRSNHLGTHPGLCI